MNKFIGIGRITKSLELRHTSSNKATTQFTIAINGHNDTTDFINCVAWEKQAENLVKYCSKGSKVCVEGKMSTRSYDDKDGKKVYVTEVIATNIEFLDDKKKDDEGVQEQPKEDNESDPFKNFGEQVQLSESDLPF